MVQLMRLPPHPLLLGLTFLVSAYQIVMEKRPLNGCLSLGRESWYMKYDGDGYTEWWLGLMVASLVTSTKLLYVEPG